MLIGLPQLVNIYKPKGASVKTTPRKAMSTSKREDKNVLLSYFRFKLGVEKLEKYEHTEDCLKI